MIKLNLAAKGEEQKLILAYLEENASEALAEKINNGVSIVKDGKYLISKKTLDGFMKFASDEARKLAGKGANSACVEDTVVYGWAIHYFEESSIEGTLYNEDGTEYKAVIKPSPKTTPAPAPKKKENPQMSLFGFLDMGNAVPMSETEPPVSENEDDEEQKDAGMEVDKETGEVIQPMPTSQKIKPFYAQYLAIKKEYGDHLLFQRLGDFYEVFAEDAKTVSDALNLTLTGRDVGLQERIAMSGIPYHAAEIYFSKLVQKGFSLAVIEHDEVKTYSEEDIDDEEIEELSQEEMRKFDGDIESEIPTVTRIVNGLNEQITPLGEKAKDIRRAGEILQAIEELPEDDDELDEKHLRTSFDKETMLYLYDLLDGKMDIK